MSQSRSTILHKQTGPRPDAVIRILAHHVPRSKFVEVTISGPLTTSPDHQQKIPLKDFPRYLRKWESEGFIDALQTGE